METKVLTVDEEASVSSAASIMSENNVGSLIATRDGKPVGIVTERDILRKVVVPCRDPRSTKVKDVMSKPLITGDPDMDIEYAAKLMVGKEIKRLPVLENGKLVGIVTFTDLVRSQPAVMKALEELIASKAIPRRFMKVLRKPRT